MEKYCVNTGTDEHGYHEVHKNSCDHLPKPEHRQDLGSCYSCSDALNKARDYYEFVDGCYYCCLSCHKH
jgi:hypothetical protein